MKHILNKLHLIALLLLIIYFTLWVSDQKIINTQGLIILANSSFLLLFAHTFKDLLNSKKLQKYMKRLKGLN